jgi:poly [ADP-ribose] polymerase
MGKVAKLIMVTGANNNKYYDMEEVDSEIKVKYGRVGVTTQTATYPISKWDSLLKSKTKKGYKDVTALRVVSESIDFQDISSDEISTIVSRLQAFANKSVTQNYTVSSDAVTQVQVEEAQKLLDSLAKANLLKKRVDTNVFNKNLLDLYQVIPRRMQRVQDHMIDSKMPREDINELLAKEQATLDVMKGQVHVAVAKQKNTQEDKSTILEAMGLEIEIATPEDVEIIKQNLGQISSHYKNAYKVKNLRCQEKYDKWLKKADNKRTRLFWHGSRNENWWSILDSGLILRPTNAVITGKMFGYGLYFADQARKSFNYTSYRGSYWARGSSDTALMCLYDVHLGNWLRQKRYENWMYQLTENKLKERGNYDSLFAEGGADIRNNEYIIYNENQCAPRYLVEFK